VADLSHRLRTPLTALRLEAHGLRDPTESARMVALASTLERTASQIIAQARRPGRRDLFVRCDAIEVVHRRVDFWAPLAEDQGRRVYLLLAPGPLLVQLADDELATLVDTLLENVFAHTPEGAEFAVTVEPRPAGGALLVVEDAGPGLPGISVPRRGASLSGSTGLGLDIVRRGAEDSGGGLALGRSRFGGARVQVDLGAARPRPVARAAATLPALD
jgi:signal transduction histidine kinase